MPELVVAYRDLGLGGSSKTASEMERLDVIDYVNGLHRAGLIHRTTDGFVFATRAAVRMVQMVGQVI